MAHGLRGLQSGQPLGPVLCRPGKGAAASFPLMATWRCVPPVMGTIWATASAAPGMGEEAAGDLLAVKDGGFLHPHQLFEQAQIWAALCDARRAVQIRQARPLPPLPSLGPPPIPPPAPGRSRPPTILPRPLRRLALACELVTHERLQTLVCGHVGDPLRWHREGCPGSSSALDGALSFLSCRFALPAQKLCPVLAQGAGVITPTGLLRCTAGKASKG